jgi:hypothetical protein
VVVEYVQFLRIVPLASVQVGIVRSHGVIHVTGVILVRVTMGKHYIVLAHQLQHVRQVKGLLVIIVYRDLIVQVEIVMVVFVY